MEGNLRPFFINKTAAFNMQLPVFGGLAGLYAAFTQAAGINRPAMINTENNIAFNVTVDLIITITSAG
ncbi:MAG: hypothetical protein J5842_05455 [Lachnospiraceae bacterium]|nr:hypothetical protein [Lachnospiraceae bacterium]